MNVLTQRSTGWRMARLGCVTASRFGDVLATPSAKGIFSVGGSKGAWHVDREAKTLTGDYTRKADAEERKAEMAAEWRTTAWSQTANTYMCELVAESIHCQPSDTWRSDATDWGIAQEPVAFERVGPVIERVCSAPLRMPVDEFAFVHHPTEQYIGCSPDGIIGDHGLTEIKCPYDGAKWIRAALALEDITDAADADEITPEQAEQSRISVFMTPEYKPQVQGQLWVAGRKWCMFVYFDPRVEASGLDPLLYVKVYRDDEYIDTILAPRVIAFRDYMRKQVHRLIKTEGPF